MARLNDTVALASCPIEAGQNHSVSVEKCDNGYLVCSSSYNDKTGEYRSRKQYYEEPPRIVPPRVSRSGPKSDAAGSRGLSDTMNYLRDK